MVVCVRTSGEYWNHDRNAGHVLSSVSREIRYNPLHNWGLEKYSLTTAHRGYICATPQGSPWDTFSCSRFYNDTPKLIVPQEINGKTTYMETMLGGPIVAYADQIEVRFQKTDFATAASTTMASASSSQTGTQTSAETSRTGEMVKPMNTAPGNGSGADSVVKSENAGKNGLTTGSYAGIGVVVGVVTIALVAVLLFLIRMRRKESGEAGILDGDWIQDDRAAEMANSTSTCEVGAREVGEVRGDTVMPVELDQKTMVHQLE
jgi:hypothetical protein